MWNFSTLKKCKLFSSSRFIGENNLELHIYGKAHMIFAIQFFFFFFIIWYLKVSEFEIPRCATWDTKLLHLFVVHINRCCMFYLYDLPFVKYM